MIRRICCVTWLIDSPSFYVLEEDPEIYIEFCLDKDGNYMARLHVHHLYKDFHTMHMAAVWCGSYVLTKQMHLLQQRMVKKGKEYHETVGD